MGCEGAGPGTERGLASRRSRAVRVWVGGTTEGCAVGLGWGTCRPLSLTSLKQLK